MYFFRDQSTLIVFLAFNLGIVHCLLDPVSVGIGAGIGVGVYGFGFFKEHTYCRMAECCNERSIPADMRALETRLSEELFGQHIVQQKLMAALQAHFSPKSLSRKPLVISFHGTPGTGKNFIADMIAEAVYEKGLQSRFVHKYSGRADFVSSDMLSSYTNQIKRDVLDGIADCPRSLFIFDEVDKMPEGVFESLTSLVEYNALPSKLDSSKAIFIFISTTAGIQISDRLGELMKSGKLRDQVMLSDFEKIVELAAYNQKVGLKRTSLIKAHVIDHYLPFLPLEKVHVYKCVAAEFSRCGAEPSKKIIDSIIEDIVTYDRNHSLFAISGCKKLEKKVATEVMLMKTNPNRNTYTFNLGIVHCLLDPVSLGIGAGIGVGVYGFGFFKEHTYCRMAECCNERSIPADMRALETRLSEELFGQHIVQQKLMAALQAHFSPKSLSRKPLVISFHGTPGTGKNFIADMIAEAVYEKGLQSRFVHKYSSYTNQIKRDVLDGIADCPRSLFIFDEVDEMPEGVFESLTSLVEYNALPSKLDSSKAIFIFISNTAGIQILDRLGKLMKSGKLRDQVMLSDFEKIVELAAYNQKVGLKRTSLIEAHVIDHYLPFLPLEKVHVYKCVAAEFSRWGAEPLKKRIDSIIEDIVTYDRNHGLFAISGCKKLKKKVATEVMLMKTNPNRNTYTFNLGIVHCLLDPVSLGIGAGIGVGVYGFGFFKEHTYCRMAECCNERSIPADMRALETRLSKELFGQHIVQQKLMAALQAHFSPKSLSRKPLVISFHGTPGTGKNFIADMIAEAVYEKGLQSRFVHKYSGRADFVSSDMLSSYTAQIKRDVLDGIADCPRSLFIFDEVDKMPEGVFESLTSLVEYNALPSKLDSSKAIFIFISNTAGVQISDRLGELMKSGKLRDQVMLSDFEKIVELAAYNQRGGLKKTSLIEAHVIDHYLPFLPLEKAHVYKCVAAEFSRWGAEPLKKIIDSIIEDIVTYDRNHGLFAISGCKKLEKKVATEVMLMKTNPNRIS